MRGRGKEIRLSPPVFSPSSPPTAHLTSSNESQLARMESPAVDDVSFLAYASVVNMKVVGTLGDERTITVHPSPAVVKGTPAAVPAVRTRVSVDLLALADDLHQNILAYLQPNWVQGGEKRKGGGRIERGGGS